MCKNLNILKKQEELLQFEHFCNDDAFELGSFMVSYARKHNITIAMAVFCSSIALTEPIF